MQTSKHTAIKFYKRSSDFNLKDQRNQNKRVQIEQFVKHNQQVGLTFFEYSVLHEDDDNPTYLKMIDFTRETPFIMKKPHCRT